MHFHKVSRFAHWCQPPKKKRPTHTQQIGSHWQPPPPPPPPPPPTGRHGEHSVARCAAAGAPGRGGRAGTKHRRAARSACAGPCGAPRPRPRAREDQEAHARGLGMRRVPRKVREPRPAAGRVAGPAAVLGGRPEPRRGLAEWWAALSALVVRAVRAVIIRYSLGGHEVLRTVLQAEASEPSRA